MSTSRALVSFVTLASDKEFRSDHLQLCTLWFDEVIIETLGSYSEKNFIEGLLGTQSEFQNEALALTDIMRPLDRELQKHIHGTLLQQSERGYPRTERGAVKYLYPEPENADQYAHNHLLEIFAKEHGVAQFENEHEVQQLEGRARVAVDAVYLWEMVNVHFPCMLQANRDEKEAMVAARRFTAGSAVYDAPYRLFEVAIPSLRNVPWNEIVRFRKDGSLRSLRKKIAESMIKAGSNLESAKSLFKESEQLAVDAIVERGRPQLRRVAIESVLANLPGMAVNPFSAFFGIRDTASEIRANQNHGWVYLLRDIEGAAKAGEDSSAQRRI